jgi:hypothetical protein
VTGAERTLDCGGLFIAIGHAQHRDLAVNCHGRERYLSRAGQPRPTPGVSPATWPTTYRRRSPRPAWYGRPRRGTPLCGH